jgi:DNA-binding CsgD family transcriptional regulator
MMLREHEALKENKLNFNIVEVAADLQTEQERAKMEIVRHEQTNRHHWLLICAIFSFVTISVIVAVLLRQRRRHRIEIKHADEKLALLVKELNRTSAEKDMISQEFEEMMNDKDNRQEIETLTPSVLQKNGESKFRQRFELLYPLFLPRLRERVPSITRREELLSMLIVLKQGNKEIAELLAIAPRSVLMLRHRFRQKVGLTTDGSLEKFIEETLGFQSDSTETAEPRSNS